MYEPFISTNVACSLQRSQPCGSAMIRCPVVLQSATTPLDATTSYTTTLCVVLILTAHNLCTSGTVLLFGQRLTHEDLQCVSIV